jgi:hypothetical protein
MQHGKGGNDLSAYEAVYGQKMNHEFSCLKEEVCQCWKVPEQLKVTNNPEFTEYVRENYIIDDEEIWANDAEGYFSDRLLPFDEKEEVLDEYFFDHLKDEISKEDHGEGVGYHTFNKFNAASDDHFVDPVWNVVGESNVEGPEQSIMMQLSKKQLVMKTTSDVFMSLRKSPPETMFDQSTTHFFKVERVKKHGYLYEGKIGKIYQN